MYQKPILQNPDSIYLLKKIIMFKKLFSISYVFRIIKLKSLKKNEDIKVKKNETKSCIAFKDIQSN